MADLFIVKARLKFSLILTGICAVLSALATWHFWNQIEFETDQNSFLLAAVVTGALILGWFGLLIFYISAQRVMNPAHSFTDRFDSLPWWAVKVLLIVVVIGTAGFFVVKYSHQAESEIELIRSGHLYELKGYLQDQPSLLNKTNAEGLTLLQMAYTENYPEAVSMLIESGANVDDLDALGLSPVIGSLDNIPMLQALLQAGVSPDQQDADGIPAIHYAVETHSKDTFSILFEAGVKVDGRDRLSRTALMRAVENDMLPIVETLLNHGASVNAFDQRGDTALHLAVRRRNPEMIRLLLQNDGDPRVFNFTHLTPLHTAVLGGQDDLVRIFLETPGLTELRDEADRTPLDQALQARKYTTAELLIENGADINRVMQDGTTSLHQAIESKDYRTARFLIRAGANPEIPDKNGRTVLDIIRIKQLSGLLDLLNKNDEPAAETNTVDSVAF